MTVYHWGALLVGDGNGVGSTQLISFLVPGVGVGVAEGGCPQVHPMCLCLVAATVVVTGLVLVVLMLWHPQH